jgi:hypothetical protein
MGFLPNIFKIPKSDIIPNIVTLGGYGLGKGTTLAAVSVVKRAAIDVVSRGLAHDRASQQSPYNQYGQPGNQYQYQPNYSQPFYDNQQMYGGSPWDSSMTSAGYSDWTQAPPVTSYRRDSTFLDWGQGPFNL